MTREHLSGSMSPHTHLREYVGYISGKIAIDICKTCFRMMVGRSSTHCLLGNRLGEYINSR